MAAVGALAAFAVDLVACGFVALPFTNSKAFDVWLAIEETVAMVLVLAWLWRSVKNIEAFVGGRDGVSALWAVVSWFVPGWNLVVPLRAVWQVIVEELTGGWVFPMVVSWWASFVAACFLETWMWFHLSVSATQSAVATILFAIAGIALGCIILVTSLAQQTRIDRASTRRAALAQWKARTSR